MEKEDSSAFPPTEEEMQARRQTVEIGRVGEELACRFLWKRGFRILERNYRGPRGEIDVIAEKSERLHFVEVKTRTSDSIASPEERVDEDKRKRIRETASYYLRKFREAPSAGTQFDVVAQVLDEQRRVLSQGLIENAF